MIKKIIEYLYNICEKNISLKTFTYCNPSKILGNGESFYDLILIEEPLRLEGDLTRANLNVTINLDVLVERSKFRYIDEDKAVKIIYQIVNDINSDDTNLFFKVKNADLLTLQDFTDDKVNGVRATLYCECFSDFDTCDDSHIDSDKTFESNSLLQDINRKDAEGCNTDFHFRLTPKFDWDE